MSSQDETGLKWNRAKLASEHKRAENVVLVYLSVKEKVARAGAGTESMNRDFAR